MMVDPTYILVLLLTIGINLILIMLLIVSTRFILLVTSASCTTIRQTPESRRLKRTEQATRRKNFKKVLHEIENRSGNIHHSEILATFNQFLNENNLAEFIVCDLLSRLPYQMRVRLQWMNRLTLIPFDVSTNFL
jgi:hypothetical protein